ncbi:MAG: hypothetical protein MI919_02020 [Holophagales bacterium]|nr:hypothetical protein [Holophagales bacterium]
MSRSVPPADLTPLTHLGLRFEAARRLGCQVVPLDPETGYLNEIRRDEVRRVLLGGMSPLNDAVASRLAADKFHTGRVLAASGYRVPHTARCLRPGRFDPEDYPRLEGTLGATELAAAHGFPLVVKPNFGSRGLGIGLVHDLDQLEAAVEAIWQKDYLALAQTPAPGFDLRIDLLDGEYLFGYVRRPVRIVGDGRHSVRQLFAELDPRFSGTGFEGQLGRDPHWARVARAESLDEVPEEGRVLDADTPILNLNRLCLGERIERLDPRWRDFGLAIGRTLSLRHFGIDFKIESLEQDPREATVIEVNASPSLVQMARMGHFDDALAAEMRVLEKVLRTEAERMGPRPGSDGDQ